jgi:dsDNA-specific endonuclease/ATPase MutS2
MPPKGERRTDYGSLIDKIDDIRVALGGHKEKLENIEKGVDELKTINKEQWTAINGNKNDISKGKGIMIAVSALSGVVGGFFSGLVKKG